MVTVLWITDHHDSIRLAGLQGCFDHIVYHRLAVDKIILFGQAGAQARFQPVWVQDVATAVVRCVRPSRPGNPVDHAGIFELCGPDVFTLKQLVALSGQLSGIAGGRGRWVFGLPNWLGRLQAGMMAWAPGKPLMSVDNLDSMKIDNVATGKYPGLTGLGIAPMALRPVAQAYLGRHSAEEALTGLRSKATQR